MRNPARRLEAQGTARGLVAVATRALVAVANATAAWRLSSDPTERRVPRLVRLGWPGGEVSWAIVAWKASDGCSFCASEAERYEYAVAPPFTAAGARDWKSMSFNGRWHAASAPVNVEGRSVNCGFVCRAGGPAVVTTTAEGRRVFDLEPQRPSEAARDRLARAKSASQMFDIRAPAA